MFSGRSELIGRCTAAFGLLTFWAFCLIFAPTNATAQTWLRLEPPTPITPARSIGASAFAPDSNRLIVFGGYPAISSYRNDLWLLSEADGTGSPTWTQAIANGTAGSPPARGGATLSYDRQNNRAILVGGESLQLAVLSDVWVLLNADGTTGTPTWNRLTPEGGFPGRASHLAEYDPQSNRLIVTMGQHPGGNCRPTCIYEPAETWILENANGLGGTPHWSQLVTTGAPPGRLTWQTGSTYDPTSNRLIVFGGYRPNQGENLSDVWVLSGANGLAGPAVWAQVAVAGPPPRYGASLFYDSASNRLGIFGGENAITGDLFNDLWILERANGLGGSPIWRQSQPAGLVIPGRSSASVGYGASTNRLVVSGGRAGNLPTPETWVLEDASQLPALAPNVQVTGGTHIYDGLPHPAVASAVGIDGNPLAGTFSIVYSPGGTAAPVAAGTYSVTAVFTSADPAYSGGGAAGVVTIEAATPQLTLDLGPFVFDGLPHPIRIAATGIEGAAVPGATVVTYSPGGSVAPSEAGDYAVSLTFSPSDLNYRSTAAAGLLRIVSPGSVIRPVSYAMRNGQSSYLDTTYTGAGCVACPDSLLSGGLGKLTDGAVGSSNWASPVAPWVGWTVDPTITFDLGLSRTVEFVRLNSNNFVAGGVHLWSQLTVDFSNDGLTFRDASTYSTSLAQRADRAARFIDVPVPPVSARFVRLRVTRGGEWVFLSEVEFHGPFEPSLPTVTISSGPFVFDGNAHPAVASAAGLDGAPVAGTFDFTYSPGGSEPPVNVGDYTVTATFTSADPSYVNATTAAPLRILWAPGSGIPISYAMANGEGPYRDSRYTGRGCVQCDRATLSEGLGELTDGVLGGLSDLSAEPWVGWSETAPPVTFDFGMARSLRTVRVHSNNSQVGGIYLWDSVTVEFSQDGVSYGNPVTYVTTNEERADLSSRFIDVALPAVPARYVRLRFTHASGRQWLFLSEIAFQATDETCAAPAEGLVSWYRGEGTDVDFLGRNHPSESNIAFGAGRVGRGFAISDGGYVDIPASATLANQTFTVGAFVTPDGRGATSDELGNTILSHATSPTDTTVGLNWRPSDQRFVFLFGNVATERIVSEHRFDPLRTYLVSASYDGATFRLYVDGHLEGSVNLTKTLAYGSAFWTIGAPNPAYRSGTTRAWSGIIDEVQFYNRALTEAEIQSLFAAGSLGVCTEAGLTPVITWATPAAVTYGTTLSGSQLSATATFGTSPVPGLFTYEPAAGTLLPAGTHTLSTTFAPTDLNRFRPVTATVTLTVLPATPTVALTGGTFVYNGVPRPPSVTVQGINGQPVAGRVALSYSPGGTAPPVNAGTYLVSGEFTSNDPNYLSVVVDPVTIVITPASPTLRFGGSATYDTTPHPASVTAVGLGGATVPGEITTILYAPGGTVAPVSAGTYSVSATFTSADPNYASTTGTGSIVIAPAAPVVTVQGGAYFFDGLPHAATATAVGLSGAVPGAFAITYLPGGPSAPLLIGNYTVAASFTSADANYASVTASGSITIAPLSPMSSVTVGTEQPAYRRGSPVRIAGQVLSADGTGVPNVRVALRVSGGGLDRTFEPYTGANGAFSYIFQPSATEGGRFVVTATAALGANSQVATSEFRLVGFTVSPVSTTSELVAGTDLSVPITVRNVGDTALTGVSFAVTVLPAGAVSVNLPPSLASLGPGETTTVPVLVSAPAGDPATAPVAVSIQLSATDAASTVVTQGQTDLALTLRPAIRAPVLQPAGLSVGVNPGRSITRRFIVRNDGYLTLQGAYVALRNAATTPWVSFGNATLGDVAPGDFREFQVLIAPPAAQALGDYSVAFDVFGGDAPISGTVLIGVTASTLGQADFVVSNDLGSRVAGATVSLYQATTGRQYQGVTGAGGTLALSGVEAGSYNYVVAAESHAPTTGTLTVTTGATVAIPVILSYDVVSISFTVTPTTITDQYNVTLNVTYSTNLPKPALQVVPVGLQLSFFPEDVADGRFACNLSVTNSHPTASVRNVTLDASELDLTRPSGERVRVLFAGDSSTFDAGSLGPRATANVPCQAILDGGNVPTHAAGEIFVRANYDFSLDGQVLEGTTTTKVPVSYIRPDELSYSPIEFTYDKRTDPANPVLRYTGGSHLHTVRNNRDQSLALLRPDGHFDQHNIVAFSAERGADSSLGVIQANTHRVFWRTNFNDAAQTLSGRGEVTSYDISVPYPDNSGVGLEEALRAQVALNEAQVINRPTYLGFTGLWSDAASPTGYLVPVRVTTILPNSISVPQAAFGGGGGCFNPEDEFCDDPSDLFGLPPVAQDGQIRLVIEQKLRLERQAFDAVMALRTSASLTNVTSSLQVRDALGQDASNRFFVVVANDPAGATRGGSVTGNTSVAWQLIPSASAGGSDPAGTQYDVQAVLNYVIGGTLRTARTQWTRITVLPAPRLTLRYSLPFVVVPGKQAKLRVSVQNVGSGPARGVSIESAQPRIIERIPEGIPDPFDEVEGPFVDFAFTGSANTADGSTFEPGRLTVNFGDLAPAALGAGFWALDVSRRGFLIDVSATMVHQDYRGVRLDALVETPTIVLVPAIGGTITGGPSNVALPALRVNLLRDGVVVGTDTTDAAGAYYIADLSGGAYDLEIRDLAGSLLASRAITVLTDQATNFIDFSLPGFNPTLAIVTVSSATPGMLFQADGVTYTTPQSFTWEIGSNHTLEAASEPSSELVPVGWSDGETSARRVLLVESGGAEITPEYRTREEVDRYTRRQLTDDNFDHKWPATNNHGDLVWSELENGYWQVFKRPALGTSTCALNVRGTCQITFDAHNHERPTISDNGAIAWFQDTTGSGLGYAIMRLDPGATTPAVVEFSSRSRPDCNPATGQCFTPRERVAGKTFGMDSTGRTVSFYTWYESGFALYRRFSVAGIGALEDGTSPVNFYGFESPDVNLAGLLTYANGFTPGIASPNRYVWIGSISSPQTGRDVVGQGINPHIADSSGGDIVYLTRHGNDEAYTDVTRWLSAGGSHWVAKGHWVDIAGTGDSATVVYECMVNNRRQICDAKKTGVIEITSNVDQSTFAVSGPITFSGTGTRFERVAPPGEYTATFEQISGFEAVVPQTATLFTGGRISFSGLFRPCTYQLSSTEGFFPSLGGVGSIDVTTSSERCVWMSASSLGWVSVDTGLLRLGSGTVRYTVLPNTTAAPRVGTFLVAGSAITIRQAGSVDVQFKGTTDPNRLDSGFDESGVVPGSPWLSVALNRMTEVAYAEVTPPSRAPEVSFASSNTSLVSVTPASALSSPQRLSVTGHAVGAARIDARVAGQPILFRPPLSVVVYPRRLVTVTIHVVTARRRPTHPRGGCGAPAPGTSRDALERALNRIWDQAAIRFRIVRFAPRSVDFDLNGNCTLDQVPHPAPGLGPEMEALIAALHDPSADINIYYVRDFQIDNAATDPGLRAVFVQDSHANTTANITAHEVGHALRLLDLADTDSLMYRTSSPLNPFLLNKQEWDVSNAAAGAF